METKEIARNPYFVELCKKKMMGLMKKGLHYPEVSESARWTGGTIEAVKEFISMRDHFQDCLENNYQWNPKDLDEMLYFWHKISEGEL
jgi:hypothetical protein